MILKFSSSYNPWIYFFLFLAVDCYLSYAPSNSTEKFLMVFVGILAPELIIIFSKPDINKSEDNVFRQEQFNGTMRGVWIFFGLLLMGLRFWKLTTLFQWPTGDEAAIGMLAIKLSRQWDWHFFHGFAQVPFLWHWCCVFTYQATHSSKLSLWLLPAVISALLIPLTYWGSRCFCGNSFSIILTGLMATGFWPMYLGRAGFPIFVVLWELVVLYFLLVFREQIKNNSGLMAAGLLGLATGLGPITATSWMAVGFAIVIFVAHSSFRDKKYSHFIIFLIFMTISLFPFLTAVLKEGYGSHIQAIVFWNGGFDVISFVTRFFDYWMILWGTVNQPVSYIPPLGGFLNPILASLFFLGLIEITFRFSKSYLFLFLAFLALCLSPGFMSWSLETFRVLTILPLLYFSTALGLRGLLKTVSPTKAFWVTVIMLGFSFFADFYRLVIPYGRIDQRPAAFEDTGRSYEKYCAGRILENVRVHYGPGLIYTDWAASAADETLAFATYPYNCAWNPDIADVNPRWGAIFTNSHFQPFLSKRFPQAKWTLIPAVDTGDQGSHVLGIIPITPETLSIFRSWKGTYEFCMETNLRFLDKANGKSNEDILEEMIRFYGRVPNDSFLQSVYLEKFMDAYERQKVLYKGRTQCDYNSYKALLNSSLKKGCPDTMVFAYAGRLLMQEGRLTKARKVVGESLRLDPENYMAARLLSVLRMKPSMVLEK